jgi:hypothetical protein
VPATAALRSRATGLHPRQRTGGISIGGFHHEKK